MKTLVLDANRFSNLMEFYAEVKSVLTDDFAGFGDNLDAFNDVLRGGFGRFQYGEAIQLVWENSVKSKIELGHDETASVVSQ